MRHRYQPMFERTFLRGTGFSLCFLGPSIEGVVRGLFHDPARGNAR